MNPIKYVPGTTYGSVAPMPDETCAICLEDLTEDVVAHQNEDWTKQQHPFHRECIQEWLKDKPAENLTCPRCFKKVTPEMCYRDKVMMAVGFLSAGALQLAARSGILPPVAGLICSVGSFAGMFIICRIGDKYGPCVFATP